MNDSSMGPSSPPISLTPSLGLSLGLFSRFSLFFFPWQLYIPHLGYHVYVPTRLSTGVYVCRYYELDSDPWEMDNKFTALPAQRKTALATELHRWLDCAGASCP